jgi:hypothetical protein
MHSSACVFDQILRDRDDPTAKVLCLELLWSVVFHEEVRRLLLAQTEDIAYLRTLDEQREQLSPKQLELLDGVLFQIQDVKSGRRMSQTEVVEDTPPELIAPADAARNKMKASFRAVGAVSALSKAANATSGADNAVDGAGADEGDEAPPPLKLKAAASICTSKLRQPGVAMGATRPQSISFTTGMPCRPNNLPKLMLSYCWAQQPVMKRVFRSLTAMGYEVWMDIQEMRGSTLSAMAKAVENTDVILMGVSSEYKRSVACRSEAEYAYVQKKPIVPLMLQQDYKPDGWLGILMGARLWIDFSDADKISESFEKLLSELEPYGAENGAQGGAPRTRARRESC